MKIQYLGTSAAEGTPAFFCECNVCQKARKYKGRNIRSRSQCLIDNNLLIDYPADTYMHTINHEFSLIDIIAVLITHTHEDHFYMGDMNMNREPCAMNKEYYRLPFYGNSDMYKALTERFGDGKDANLAFNHAITFEELNINDYKVIPLRALHDRRQECLIYSIEKNGKRFLYGNDTGLFPHETMDRIKGLRYDAISLDTTTGKDKDGNNHMGFIDIVEMKKRLIENGNADDDTLFIAQHFSHNCGYIYDETVEVLEPLGFIVAYDGMELVI